MISYWGKDCPVPCSNTSIKATVYKSADEVIISVANWNVKDEKSTLKVDWTGIRKN